MNQIDDEHICSICQTTYTNNEGGIQGYFGILPVSFCPTCLNSAIDMVQQLVNDDFDHG